MAERPCTQPVANGHKEVVGYLIRNIAEGLLKGYIERYTIFGALNEEIRGRFVQDVCKEVDKAFNMQFNVLVIATPITHDLYGADNIVAKKRIFYPDGIVLSG